MNPIDSPFSLNLQAAAKEDDLSWQQLAGDVMSAGQVNLAGDEEDSSWPIEQLEEKHHGPSYYSHWPVLAL